MEKEDYSGCLTLLYAILIPAVLAVIFNELPPKWSLSIVGIALLIGMVCWLIARIKHRRKANRLVDEFLNGIRNNAVEYAETRPEKEMERLFVRLEKFMLDYLYAYKWDPRISYANFLVRKLYLIDHEKAKAVVERVRKETLDELEAMVNSKKTYEQIIDFMHQCWDKDSFTMELVDVLGEVSARGYANALIQRAKPCIEEVANRIEAGELFSIRLNLGELIPGIMIMRNVYLADIKLSAHFIELNNAKIPLCNIMMLSYGSSMPKQAVIFISPDNFKYLVSVDPMMTLKIGLIFAMRNRLPDAERNPAREVKEVLDKESEKIGMAYLDFQDTLRRIRHEKELQREEIDRLEYYSSHND